MEQRNHDALLVTIANRRFINQAKQLFSSVYWNAGWKGDYMLLAHEIPEKDLKWFRDKGILVKKCKQLYQKRMRSYSSVLSSKLYLFTPEFKKWKNIVYLDADIIVRASLDRLARVKGFWAVQDMNQPRLKGQYAKNEEGKIYGKYDLNNKTFNGGVFAFSTNIITESTLEEIFVILQKYISISIYADQLILNLFFYKKWRKLPLLYNVFPSIFIKRYDFKPKDIGGIILHFVRFDKEKSSRPWDKNNPFYSEWKINLRKAEKIDLNDISRKAKYNLFYLKYFFYIKRLYSIGKFFIKSLRSFFHYMIYFQLKNFIIYQIIARLKVIPDRILGIIGQLIKAVSPALYNKLKGKNGTKKS